MFLIDTVPPRQNKMMCFFLVIYFIAGKSTMCRTQSICVCCKLHIPGVHRQNNAIGISSEWGHGAQCNTVWKFQTDRLCPHQCLKGHTDKLCTQLCVFLVHTDQGHHVCVHTVESAKCNRMFEGCVFPWRVCISMSAFPELTDSGPTACTHSVCPVHMSHAGYLPPSVPS